MEPVVQDAGARAGAFLLEAEGAVEVGGAAVGLLVGVVGGGVGYIVPLIVIIAVVLVPPWHDLYLQLSQPVPHRRARPIRIAERSETAPSKGLDAGDGEVVDGEVSEERDVGALEREAKREEGLERILVRGDEAEVL